MKRRAWIVTLACLVAVVGAWLLWPRERSNPAMAQAGKTSATVAATAPATASHASPAAAKLSTLNTNKLAYRLANTTNSIRELEANTHAILLANAFIDTDKSTDLKIPAHLRSKGDPGAYIVQARGSIDAAFRALLQSADAQIVSYEPNNAYLVKVPGINAQLLAANPLVQAVIPYEPYFKLQSSLLGLAVDQQPLPPGTALTLGVFAADAGTAEAQVRQLGGRIIGRDQSPFGPVLKVLAPTDWTSLVQLSSVQYVEPSHARRFANDLSRVTFGISPDTTSGSTNDYLGLNGKNVLVAVNDSGVDAAHPDFSLTGTASSPGATPPSRVVGLTPLDLVDTNGHGTHVAGIIAGNGSQSLTPTNVGTVAQGSVPNADFRGKAPLADLFSLYANDYSDYQLQTNAALAGALISNNSWDYGNGSGQYDLAAASYDFATRDAVPFSTGSQPVLFVFAAGNDGGGNNDGGSGSGDTILSPGTAKNVITVGALEQLRNITNIVTTIDPGEGTNAPTTNQVAFWQPETDSSEQVAFYSSRGNVGIGTEGAFGRFKPDVVSPGSFVVSTSSQFNHQFDTNAYYNPTNDEVTEYDFQVVATNDLAYYSVSVPPNTVGIKLTVRPNSVSPVPFPNLAIYCQQSAPPDPFNAPGMIDITATNQVLIPPGAGNCTISQLQNNGFDFAVGNANGFPVDYNLFVEILTTNSVGDLNTVLEGLNDSLGGYYRYESGTSMAAAGVSGLLALVQDYFTNKFQPAIVPSPALMKALLINGARSDGSYTLALTNGINFQGWGLDDLQNIIPAGGLINQLGAPGSSFFVDQDPSTALATGDSRTFLVTLNTDTNSFAQYFQLQATLVWTDPPGDPAAAIKLVNSLELIVTNLDTGDVYIGNDIAPDIGYNLPSATNVPPNVDYVNNVQNVLLPPLLAGSYSVTVVGRSVNVNAVTAQINNAAGQYAPNIVQDYALVVSVGEGEVTNAFTVTQSGNGIYSNPTGDQDLTVITTTNAPLVNQLVGASSPLLGTNRLALGTHTVWGPNGALTIGQTNQWHFYVVTNTGIQPDYTNAAFLTYNVSTLSIPRMGVYEDNVTNATKPEANLDLFVTDDPSITNLNPVAISNCLAGAGNGRASLANAGTQFVFYTNSVPGRSIYYIGIQSEDQMAAEYDFLPVFTDIPFSSLDQNGNQIVNGLLLPMPIHPGSNAHPSVTNVFALAIMPMEVEKVTVTNLVEHQNFGDLVGTLSFGGQHAILNNHDGFGNTYGTRPIVYDDSQDHPLGTTNTDGPGSLLNFRGQSALGPWILSELANSAGGFTGQVSRLTLLIQPHRDLKQPGIIVSVPPGGWFIDYVDVSPGYTNLTFYGTNVTVSPGTPPLQMYERLNLEPTQNNFDQEATLTNGTPPGNSISLGPPLSEGRYFVGIYNPDGVSQNVYLSASLGVNASVSDVFNFDSGSTLTLPDDAVTGSVIRVPDLVTQLISSVNVGLVVKSPRISDYTFTLVSPTGQRVLLMENRGAGDTNGAGSTFVFTNILNAIASGGPTANTNYLAVDPNGTSFPLTWNFYTQPDQMTIYDSTNPADFNPNGPYLIYNTGLTNNPTDIFGNNIPVNVNIQYPLGTTAITIIMNQLGNPDTNGSDLWTYNAGAAITNYEYLEFTDNTNLANVPIKFAAPPFNFTESFSNVVFSDLNRAVATNYYGPTNIADGFGTGWSLPTNLLTYSTIVTNAQFATISNLVSLTNNFVTVETDPSTALGGSNVLALARGTITRLIPTTPGRLYNVTFWYRGPGIAGWWRGEGNALDSSDPENLHNNGTLIGRFNFPAGEVDQAFGFGDPGNTYQFAGTNTYVQVPASRSLDVGAGGGFTVEGWINPTNVSRPAPLVEWLAKVPTNAAVADTNLAIVQGPVFNPATGHYYYLLSPTNWITSANWAAEMGGTLATLETANENQWIYDTFTAYGTLNRDLWIGLNDYGFPGAFNWKGSTSRVTFTDWTPGEPAAACSSDDFVAIMGPTNAYPGLWSLAGNNREICGHAPALPIYGVVEVPQLQPNGVQFWVSGTNGTPAGANPLSGSLYANIVDVNDVSHPIVSAPGLLVSNVYQHVALTYNTNSGIAALYLNGTNVAYTNIGVFVPKTSGDLLIGQDMSAYTNNYFGGEMDEMSLYSRSLSLAEISAIYHASADTSNRLVGKFDAAVTPAVGLAEALVAFGPATNVIFGFNNQWTENSYTFTATSNSMPLTISGLEPGILLDSFSVAEAPETNLYYLPEQDLSALAGSSAAGNWSLQIWDNRVGAYVTNANQLVDWQLSFVLASNAVVAGSLQPLTPLTGTVPGGQTVYYAVPVPLWAHAATNILLSSSLPVDLLYYGPANPPTGGNAADANWLTGSTGGIGQVLVTNGTPPLLPGQTYYLAVRNNNAHAATVSLEVDFDIYGLSNNVPVTGDLTNEYQAVRYFSYDVGSNAYEATFQLLELSGNADLVVRKGIPLPGLQSADYGSFSPSNADESIYVLTNSTPVVLSPGRWYIGVYNRDNTLTHYSVLAKELDITGGVTNFTVIDLTNGVPFTWTAGPGAALTNFFRFHATDPIVGGNTEYLQGLRFEVYDLSGNGDLTVATNIPPLAPPFFQTSQNPGTDPELVFVYTNSALPDLAGDWYLGVPNREVTNISYTIIAEVLTNAYFPAFPGAEGAGGGALGGRFGDVYHVTSLADSGPSTLRDAVTSAAGPRTVVFDASGTISLQTPLIITASDLTIAGETAPGGGITVAGQMTSISGAHDVVIRDVRFRRGAADDSLQLLNVSNSIADHISAEWTSDNLVSILNSSNVTVQWSLMGDSLYSLTNWDSSNPPTGSLLRQGAGSLSFHHNLYADNYTGSPRLGDNLTLDFVNNVIYNWGAHSGLTGTNDTDLSPGGYTNRLNYVANYLIAGPDTALLAPGNFNMTNIAFLGTFTNASAATWIFQTNNFIDSDINGQLNGSDTGWGMFTNDYTRFGRGFPTVPVGVDEAYLAYEKVLDFAGTESATRDSIDTNIIARVRNQTGRLISSPPYTGIIAWWKAEGNAIDSVGANNGILTGGLGFAPGEVGQEFHFSNTNDYVFVPAAPALNVGADSGFTIEEWIRPSNVLAQMPLFGWGTNASLQSVNTNVILGPILNTNNGHFYYLLQTNTWSNSESIAVQLGGHLATVRNVSEQLWISNTFSMYAGVPRNLWIGLYDPSHDSGVGAHAQNFVWISGDPSNFRPWASGEPNDCGGDEFWGMVFAPYPAYLSGTAGLWNDLVDSGANCGAPGFLALNGVVEATNPPVGAPYFWISVGAPGSLYANLLDATNGSHVISTGSLLQSNVYQHVAWTYNTNSGVSTLYLNGSVVASANVGPIVLNTTGDVYLGKRIDGAPSDIYSGGMDEVTLYKRALSAGEISAIYEAGKAGKFMSQYASGGFVLPYLDTDQDGLPDFWEYTFTPNQVFMPSNNQDRNGDGYTDLEEYDNWLAAPHALTVTNTATGVDLYQMFGESGNLAFYVTNAVHGQVYLTNVLATVTNTSPVWSNTIAYFTPQANYSGYASFDCYVTNLDTAAYFGPVTVSVIVSAVQVVTNYNFPPNPTPLFSGVPVDPINTNGTDYYYIDVTTNDYGAVFEIDDPQGPLAIVVNQGLRLPSLSYFDYATNMPPAPANQQIFVLTNSSPVPLSPGRWNMGVVNEAGSNVEYTVNITLLQHIYAPEFLYPTNGALFTNIETTPFTLTCLGLDTNTPPLPLSFSIVSGPSNLTITTAGVIHWTSSESQGGTTNLVAVSVSNGGFSVTNTFSIVVEISNQPPVLPVIPNQLVLMPGGQLLVTNSAYNPNLPNFPLLGYTLRSTVTGANVPVIDTNGVITWTPLDLQSGSNYLLTTVVTDSVPGAINANSLSATNSFYVTVLPELGSGGPVGFTNLIPGEFYWFAVPVPTNALYATNTLVYSTLPINLWFTTNLPPTITNAADRVLLWDATNGVSILSTSRSTAPTNIVPGGYYLLGVQNTNATDVSGELDVSFALAPPPYLSLPFIPDQYVIAGDTLVVADTATDENPAAPLTYRLVNPPAGATINGSGIITWHTTVPMTVTITAVVTDAGAGLSATNSFAVVVLPGLGTGGPGSGTVSGYSTNWYIVRVPPNADMATNSLISATAPLNLEFSTNRPPSIGGLGDSELLTNVTSGFHVITTSSAPALVAGSRYFLGLENTNSFAVNYQLNVTFHFTALPIFSIVQTNRAGTNGFLITWYAPTNYQFHLQWTPQLAPATWMNFNGVISDVTVAPGNGQFQYFDDGSQTGGFGPTRFYRLLLLNSPTNTAPFFLNTPMQFPATPLVPFLYTNSAADWDLPLQILTYFVTNTLAGTNVTINSGTGVIAWTPDPALAGLTNIITTVVFDNGVPLKSATNSFAVVVGTNLAPVFSSIAVVSGGVKFQWSAPTNEEFQIRWTTNLAPDNWHLFPNTNVSTTGGFSFVDTNTPLLMKFYQLILLP